MQPALQQADALLITAGAGMGVDSGLPDFRGDAGFWKAYPPYERLGYSFVEMANPARFADDPALGWGFYGHRLNLYRATTPHVGFTRLLEFGQSLAHPSFVFSSNVDGHFQAAGFPESHVAECHGSIRHFQRVDESTGRIWPAPLEPIAIDETTMRAHEPLPRCPDSGALARPAILMFGDWGWNGARTAAQMARYETWLREIESEAKRLVIFEFGAGSTIPTVRLQSEQVARSFGERATLIRINPREPEIPDLGGASGISLASGALSAIESLLAGTG